MSSARSSSSSSLIIGKSAATGCTLSCCVVSGNSGSACNPSAHGLAIALRPDLADGLAQWERRLFVWRQPLILDNPAGLFDHAVRLARPLRLPHGAGLRALSPPDVAPGQRP